MENMKQKIKDSYLYIIAILTGIIGIIAFFYKDKHKEINSLKAQLDLAETQKQVDLVEVQINQKKNTTNLLQKEVDELNKTSIQLEEKRKQLVNTESKTSDKDIEDFWNKKK